MGKLHKLRKTIEQNPEAWIQSFRDFSDKRARGALLVRNKFRPSYHYYRPYRLYVKKILKSLGYDVE